jgi:hypothetical protein
VLGTAALHAGVPGESPDPPLVILDIAGPRVELDPHAAARLRDVAASCAGRSSAARDLSLLLDRALSRGRVLALRRAEAQTLCRLASDVGLLAVARELAARAA